MFCYSCSTALVKHDDPVEYFKKICMEGTGKGRIELLTSKYIFDYESQINKKTNHFDLALAFPIIGEKQLSLSLNPKETAQEVSNSDLLQTIESRVGDHYNKQQLMNAFEEFFVLTSEFLYYRSQGQFPSTYTSRIESDHFFMERLHAQFRFEVESFAETQGFFSRVLVKIFPIKPESTVPLFTLFLVPETCDR